MTQQDGPCTRCAERDVCSSPCSCLRDRLPPRDAGRQIGPRVRMVPATDVCLNVNDVPSEPIPNAIRQRVRGVAPAVSLAEWRRLLPPRQAEAAHWCWSCGQTMKSAADRMGVSDNTIRLYLKLAKRKARSAIPKSQQLYEETVKVGDGCDTPLRTMSTGLGR